MSSRRAAAPLLLAALLLGATPHALADGEDAPKEYDPLDLHLHGHLTQDGRIVREAPPAARLTFGQGDASSPPPPLEFSLSSPVRFVPVSGLTVSLLLETSAPLPAQDKEGKSFELSLLADGEPVKDATARVATSPVLVPGKPERATITIQAPGATFDENSLLTLRVRPLMPAVPADTLRLVVGEGASTAAFERMRVPSVRDLGLNDGLLEYHLEEEAYAPSDPDVTPYAVRVLHASVPFGGVSQPTGAKIVLLFQGLEDDEASRETHALLDRDARRAAAHTFLVDNRTVRVHPGVGVVVPLASDEERTFTVECVANCPPHGFSASVRFRGAEALEPVGPRPDGGLIPPPPDTSGVPVSRDAPSDEKGVPAPGAMLSVLAAAAATAARTRNGGGSGRGRR